MAASSSRPARDRGEDAAATCPGCGRPVEECQAEDVDESFPKGRPGKGLQTLWFGSLQAWMFKRGWRHLPNTLSTARWLLWRATGGNYGD